MLRRQEPASSQRKDVPSLWDSGTFPTLRGTPFPTPANWLVMITHQEPRARQILSGARGGLRLRRQMKAASAQDDRSS
jgi:hypothetical protein